MKTPWQIMTAGDGALILALLALALGGLAWLGTAPQGQRVIVTCDERTLFTAPLDQPRTVDLSGPLGPTRLVIEAGGARITASPCPRKICMAMGTARHAGDLLACVPNRIVVHVDAPGEEAPYDLLSR